jgi:hypothetical protein
MKKKIRKFGNQLTDFCQYSLKKTARIPTIKPNTKAMAKLSIVLGEAGPKGSKAGEITCALTTAKLLSFRAKPKSSLL